jgi:hypothetical protein
LVTTAFSYASHAAVLTRAVDIDPKFVDADKVVASVPQGLSWARELDPPPLGSNPARLRKLEAAICVALLEGADVGIFYAITSRLAICKSANLCRMVGRSAVFCCDEPFERRNPLQLESRDRPSGSGIFRFLA